MGNITNYGFRHRNFFVLIQRLWIQLLQSVINLEIIYSYLRLSQRLQNSKTRFDSACLIIVKNTERQAFSLVSFI